ncbi:MAG: acyltransferase [Algicola sp.]|nr:acyltransferase [Algicola sp.]
MGINYEKRIFGLDIMRAVAILLVVASHAIWIFPPAKTIFSELLSVAGLLGVEIFFVLSGFLIGRLIFKQFTTTDFSFNSVLYFWIRRWFRTLPNYYLILLFNIVLATILGIALPDSIWKYGLFIQNLAWEMPLFFGESWSLPIEEFAYILGPLLLYIVLIFNWKINRSKLFLIITCFIIILFTITKMFYNAHHPNTNMMFWNVNLKAVTIYRIDAIYYGVLASYVAMTYQKFWSKVKYLSLILGGVMFLALNIGVPALQLFIEDYSFFWNVMYLPINSIAIALVLPYLSQIQSAPKVIMYPITLISLISYSMYLLHYSVILQLMKHIMPTEGLSSLQIILYLLGYVGLTIIASYGLYQFFEKPMTNLRDASKIKNHFK